jgi:hypothetical protein
MVSSMLVMFVGVDPTSIQSLLKYILVRLTRNAKRDQLAQRTKSLIVAIVCSVSAWIK